MGVPFSRLQRDVNIEGSCERSNKIRRISPFNSLLLSRLLLSFLCFAHLGSCLGTVLLSLLCCSHLGFSVVTVSTAFVSYVLRPLCCQCRFGIKALYSLAFSSSGMLPIPFWNPSALASAFSSSVMLPIPLSYTIL